MDKKLIFWIKMFFFITVLCTYSCEQEKNEIPENKDILGCTNNKAINFLNTATVDDGSCEYLGCTDPESINFDSLATINDGNCLSYEYLPEGYSLFWNDEFNGDTLDLRFWNVELMEPGTVNNELQTYTNSVENILLNNGY